VRAISCLSWVSFLSLLARALLGFFTSATLAADFAVPAPSLSLLAPFTLETGLRTPNAELLFLQSRESSANGFVGIDSATGGFLGSVKPWPAQIFGTVKILRTRDGGFVRATMQQSFGFPQSLSTVLQKFNAQGQWQASRYISFIGGSFDLTEAADGKIVFIIGGLYNLVSQNVDMSESGWVYGGYRSYAELCPDNVLSATCQLYASLPHRNSLQASGATTFMTGRRIQTSFESNSWSLLRLTLTGKVLRAVELGSLPKAQSMQFLRNPTGTLVQVLDAQSYIIEHRFLDENDNELWRLSTERMPALYKNVMSQADASGLTVFADLDQSIFRVASSGQSLWQITLEPAIERIFNVSLGRDGSAIYSSNSSGSNLNPRGRWMRADGSQVALPASTTNLCFADDSGAYGLVREPAAPGSTEPRQSLWRFNAQGHAQTQSRLANFALPPEAIQLRQNPLGGVDLAATYPNQANSSVRRMDANGEVQTRFEVPIRGELYMSSVDQLFVRTPENTLARIASNGAVLWERALFAGAAFRFLAVSDGLALASDAGLRTLDAQGNVVASFNLPGFSGARFECYRTDIALSGDQQRCLYRAREDSPLEIYGVNSALQIQLRQVLFRAGNVVSMAADGDLLISVSPPFYPLELARFSGSGQLRWRVQLQTHNPVVFASASGGAWVREYDVNENAVISYIDSNGARRIASVLRQPVLGLALLSDSSLLIANLNALVRFQPINGGIRISTKSFAADRVFNSDLSAEGMRATWRERSNDGGNGAFVSVFDWSLR
jgi:hypothetical protein